MRRLNELLEQSLNLSGEPIEIIRQILKLIGGWLDIKVVGLTEIQQKQMKFLTICNEGEFVSSSDSYLLAGTPCAEVVHSKAFTVYNNVISRFPQAAFLKTYNALTYAGIPVLDHHRDVLAIIWLLDDKPRDFSKEEQAVLLLLARNIGLELEHMRLLQVDRQHLACLKATEERLDLAVRMGKVGFFEKRHTDNSFHCSAELRDMLGWSADEKVTEQLFFDSILPQDRQRVLENLYPVTSAPELSPIPIDYRILRRDGKIRWLTNFSQTFFHTQQNVCIAIRTLCTEIDVTDNKQLEQKYRLYESALQSKSEGVLITDAERRILFVNPGFEQITGYDRYELLGGKCDILQGPNTHAETAETIHQTLNAQQSFQGEILNYRKDGRAFWNELSIDPIFDETGHLSHFVGVQRDITERKQRQKFESIRKNVLSQIDAELPLPAILQTVTNSLVALYPDMKCAIQLTDKDGQYLSNQAATNVPEAFLSATNRVAIGPCAGSCGTAAFRKELVIVGDISQDSLWANYRSTALDHDIQACCSQPVLTDQQQVLGTVAIYYKQCRRPSDLELALLSEAAAIVRLTIEQSNIQTDLRIADTAFETNEGILVTDSRKSILRANRAISTIYGYSQQELLGKTPSIFQSGENTDEFYQNLWETLRRDNFWKGEILDKRKNGEIFPAWLSITAIQNTSGVVTHYVATIADMSEYKRNRDALQQHRDQLQQLVNERTASLLDIEQRYQQLLDNELNCATITLDVRGGISNWNPCMERLFSYTAAEIIGHPVSVLYANATDAPEMDMRQTVKLDRLQKTCWLRRKDGSRFWAHIQITSLYNRSGNLDGFSFVARDLTEQNQQISSLQQSSVRLNAILNAVIDAVIVIDEQGLIDTFNPAAEHLFGYSCSEALGRNVNILIPEPHHSRHDDHLRRYLETGERHVIGKSREVTGMRKDGSLVPLEVEVAETQIGDKRLFTGVVRDISERLKANAAQRQLTDELIQFKKILDQVEDCVFIFRADTLFFFYVNEGATRQVGYSKLELLQMTALDLKPEINLQQFRQLTQPLVDGLQSSVTVQTAYRNKDGHLIPVEAKIQYVCLPGQAPCFIAVVRDISERKQFERALITAQQEAERANQAKSALLATMSHEIRTPMNGVIGMIDLLHQSSLEGYQVEMVELIRESAYALLNIIEDILDISKIEAGKLELEILPMDLREVIENACKLLDHLALKKSVELMLFIDPMLPAKIMGDPMRLRQILINLINNAIKFSSGLAHKGQVSVRVLLINCCQEQAEIEVRIIDNGIGMDAATQTTLFSPFIQADASTTRRFGGTGLGLTIARQLIRLMQGDIKVQSALGEGSAFSLRLPFARVSSNAETPPTAPMLAGLSCYVAGNSPWLNEDMTIYLRHAGATVMQIPDLKAAREQIETESATLRVWLFVTEEWPFPMEALSAIADQLSTRNNRFVLFGRGKRRVRWLVGEFLVLIDRNILTQKTAVDCVATVAGKMQKEDQTGYAENLPKSRSAFNPPTRVTALGQGQLILVAEDNETNQKVITRQLALLGFAADVVVDGQKALNRWRSGDYALLLTDLQMPEMDGYALTKAIRAEEGEQHLPIIVLTANATHTEAEQCLAAGMDAYLSKPVQLEDLEITLKKWMPESIVSEPDNPATPAFPVDLEVLKGLIGDDPELIQDFLQEFKQGATQIAAMLTTAYQANQVIEVVAQAHKLKSSARSVGAIKLGDLCADIEQAGKKSQLGLLDTLIVRFKIELTSVLRHLDAM